MPYLETVDELVEHLADLLGIHNQRGNHIDCACRQCWCGRIGKRIRQAVAHERGLTKLGETVVGKRRQETR